MAQAQMRHGYYLNKNTTRFPCNLNEATPNEQQAQS